MQRMQPSRDVVMIAISAACLLILMAMGISKWAGSRGTAKGGPPGLAGPTDQKVYLLVNDRSGRCLTVHGGGKAAGDKVEQGPLVEKAGPAEHWVLLKVDDAFRVMNRQSGMVMEVPGANKTKGVQLIQWRDSVTSPNQYWAFERVGMDYVVKARHSDLVLAVGQGALTAGAPAVQWPYVQGVQDQLWHLVPVRE